jgi:hypothetical protein
MTEQRYTHAETLELLKADPMSQEQAVRATMAEFDARLEELQKYCSESMSEVTGARIATIRNLIGCEIGGSDGD